MASPATPNMDHWEMPQWKKEHHIAILAAPSSSTGPPLHGDIMQWLIGSTTSKNTSPTPSPDENSIPIHERKENSVCERSPPSLTRPEGESARKIRNTPKPNTAIMKNQLK